MRRFTTTSITMLTGLVLAPACGAVLGIDTDRVIDNAGTSSSSSGSSATSNDDGGTQPPPRCDIALCKAASGSCVDGTCKIDCSSGCDVECPPEHDCELRCLGAGCSAGACTGGRSCRIDCSTGTSCRDVVCTSPACTFVCADAECAEKGNKEVSCTSDVKTCAVECSGVKLCDKRIKCCPSPMGTCPPGTKCGDDDDDDG